MAKLGIIMGAIVLAGSMLAASACEWNYRDNDGRYSRDNRGYYNRYERSDRRDDRDRRGDYDGRGDSDRRGDSR